MSHCHTCRFARWQRTPTGRVSRSAPGQCTWTKTVRVPHAFSGTEIGETSLHLTAGMGIWWRDAVVCPVYEKEPQP